MIRSTIYIVMAQRITDETVPVMAFARREQAEQVVRNHNGGKYGPWSVVHTNLFVDGDNEEE